VEILIMKQNIRSFLAATLVVSLAWLMPLQASAVSYSTQPETPKTNDQADKLKALIERNENPQINTINTPATPTKPEEVLTEQKFTEITIPSTVAIPVVFKYPVTSDQLRTGDIVPIGLNEDVYIDNILVFKKGTDGALFVDKAKGNGAFGRGGSINISGGKITDVFGNEHTIKVSGNSKGDGSAAGVVLPILSLAILWPLAFFAFKKGKDAVIPAGKLLYAYTTSPEVIKVKSEKITFQD
jgi:hypothetical protein